MQKILIAVACIAGATLTGIGPSQAQYSAYGEGRYCAIVNNGTGSVREICNFDSFEACRMEVVSGNRGTCSYNPRYVARGQQWGGEYQDARPMKRRRHHRRRH